MKISTQLTTLLSVAAIGLLIVFGIGIVKLDQVYDETNFCNVNSLPSIMTLDGAVQDTATMRVSLWKSIAEEDQQKVDELNTKIIAAKKN